MVAEGVCAGGVAAERRLGMMSVAGSLLEGSHEPREKSSGLALGLLVAGVGSLALAVAVHCLAAPDECSQAASVLWLAALGASAVGLVLTSSGLLLLRRQPAAIEMQFFDAPDEIGAAMAAAPSQASGYRKERLIAVVCAR